jgi:outer membrane biosynthesis protein TonB
MEPADNKSLKPLQSGKQLKLKAYLPIIIFMAGLLMFSSVASYQLIFKARAGKNIAVDNPEITGSLTNPLDDATGDDETRIPGIIASPTATPKLTPTPTKIPTKAPSPTLTPTSSPTPTLQPTLTPTVSPTPTPTPVEEEPTPSPTQTPSPTTTNSN